MDDPDDELKERNRRIKAWLANQSGWVKSNVPPGVRTLVGVLLIIGGVLGFLPILGFWMIPLGVIFITLDASALAHVFARLMGIRPHNQNAQDDDHPEDGGT